jgi:transcriptional regulator with XRE-family HTH domain
MNGFGVLFGRLVREKRGIEGLSQDGLAETSDVTKARISDLENGKIANPHTKTVDALCVALNISRDERAACHPAAVSSLPPGLLENLARHFGYDNPDALESELERFLSDKADQFGEMQRRLAQMGEVDEQISGLLATATSALGEGDFLQADLLLAEAEKIQFHSTTIAVERQSRLRIERGNAALMKGSVALATDHFERSAQYFSGIDVQLEAKSRRAYVTELRYYGYRYGSPEALYAARNALQKNLGVWERDVHPEDWCQTKNALGGVVFDCRNLMFQKKRWPTSPMRRRTTRTSASYALRNFCQRNSQRQA